jgi:hypothetical protein
VLQQAQRHRLALLQERQLVLHQQGQLLQVLQPELQHLQRMQHERGLVQTSIDRRS